MARIRQIKPDFYLDDDLALCSRDARLMFPGLWMLADRDGRLEDRPARIKVQIFPYDQDISPKEVGVFLDELAAHCFIIRYQAGGKNLIQIKNFKKHQHCHPKEPESLFPPPKSVAGPENNGQARESPENSGQARGASLSSPSAFTSTYTYTGGNSSSSSSGEGYGEGLTGKPGASREKPTTTTTTFPTSDFVLTEKLRNDCQVLADKAEIAEIDMEGEAEAFRDHYARDGTLFDDLDAAFRKWFRDTIAREKRARAPTNRRESRAERNERIIREIEADDRAKSNQGGGLPH